MDNNNKIGFQLIGIRTDQFAIVNQEFDINKQFDITVIFEIGKDNNQKIVSVLFKSKFIEKETTILILECSCNFKISDESWNTFQDPDSNVLILPSGFISHLAVITVGTARGILHAKTEGTKFNGLILPTLNISEVFKSDVRIE